MKDREQAVIPVGDEDVSKLLGADIVAFQFAEGGAMGSPGGVYIVTIDRKIYYTCYLEPSAYTGFSKPMSWKNLSRIFPPLDDFHCGLAGYGVQVPGGWHYEYLGMGNHLLVRSDWKERFDAAQKKLKEELPDSILYNRWLPAILSVL